ncbi:glycosyltransferase [Subtercola boreus]|uniref:Glycosyltransferase n=1 Tax=Subtercola boreus TaxID=120213 RepID=A0A3E0VXY5_9MICO|nr:DUF2064 domain-containing protein [Subtercola boreus]RFA14183.1 glycosyltransferase [Subtercola boreus]
MLTVIVIAKECVPGRVKTRLAPDLTFEQAAAVASASLADTLDVVRGLPAERRILAFDGDPANAPVEAEGFELIPQAEGGLDARLADIFSKCEGPTLLVGMDTPQLLRSDLEPILSWPQGVDSELPDAWLGLSTDGGFWALAMANPDGSVIEGVPMSQDDTGSIQLDRLHQAGLTVGLLASLTDVDTAQDAALVASLAPEGRFAAAWRAAGSENAAPTRTARDLAGARA